MTLKQLTIASFVLLIGAVLYSFIPKKPSQWTDETPVQQVLVELGDKKPLHYIDNVDPEMARKGKELVTQGYTTNAKGKKTPIQSKFFVCIDCHNIQIEDPNLTKSDPEARLQYVVENNMGFLQGTTFYGVADREHWYNDDYDIKYGDFVKAARDTLENAVHLCATECSQGRDLTDYEMNAVMNYFWSISFKMSDLQLTNEEKDKLNGSTLSNEEKIALIKSKYLNYSPATFLEPKPLAERKYGEGGDPVKGKQIYDQSCLTCHHHEYGVADLKLDYTHLTFNMFERNLDKNTDFSIYYIIRKGTHAGPGYHPYMPLFTKERMSEQQMEDLVAFIKSETK